MLFKFAIIGLLFAGALARSTGSTDQNAINVDETPRADDSYSYMGDLRYMYKVYQQCAGQELFPCLKLKLVGALDRAARSYNVELVEGVTFVKDPNAQQTNEQPKTEAEIEATLPRSLNEKDEALSGLIFNKVGSFLESHSLQIKLPSSADIARSLSDEARGKKNKKGSSMLLLPLILGGTLVPLALGALALLAGKALIVSKLALVLAGIIGIKKLLSGNSGQHDAGHVEVVSSGHNSGWKRSYEQEEAARLAYQAYDPKKQR
ncbi:osiris 8 [Rhynchophorus ferrugineus]|uniref:osiris 8 n=1 Tax=Rhynchophorus ferrugineus TaxID=354439 RepID=UPI003FCD0035